MLCRTEPYNYNGDVRIDNSQCGQYTLTNLSCCEQAIEVRRLNNGSTAYSENTVLPAHGTVGIALPTDGIYSVKGNGQCTDLHFNSDDMTAYTLTRGYINIFDFGAIAGGTAINSVTDTVSATVLYDENIDGASTLAAPTNMLTTIGAIAGTNVALVAPTVALPSGLGALYPSTTGWRLLVFSTTVQATQAILGGITYALAARVVAYYLPVLVNGRYYVGAQVNGTELMLPILDIDDDPCNCDPVEYDKEACEYYLNNDVEQGAAFIALLHNALSSYGTLVEVPSTSEFAAIYIGNTDAVPTITIQVTDSKVELVEHTISWCTTLFELCGLWNCIQPKIAEWLCCTDPCNAVCTEKPNGHEWIDQVLNLTMWGIMPLLTEHKLWQFGNMSDNEGANLQRLQPTILLWDRWYKLIQGCGCPEAKGCGQCSGGGLIIPQSPIIQPPGASTGGCGCGC